MAPIAKYVPGRWITPPTTPGWWRSGAYGTPRRRWQKGHYVLPGGRWTTRPGGKKKGTVDYGNLAADHPLVSQQFGLNEDEIARRAATYADSIMAGKSAAIERARAAAQAQAERDAATYSALGQAQMGMIGQIPANIQAIRNEAGTALASYGNQLSSAAAQGLQAQQAANAAFTQSQTGMAPGPVPAAPAGAPVPAEGAPTDGAAAAAGAPAPGPGSAPGPGPASGTEGLNAQAAMAASAQMGGVLPARLQAEMGSASATAATGMPAVVARATQDQVAMRMSQAATEDADYRQQLIDLASERGGVYEDALSNLYDLETKKFGLKEANERLKLDQQQFEWKKRQDVYQTDRDWQEFQLKKQAELAAEVQAGVKSRQQAQREYRAWVISQQKYRQQQTRLGQYQQGIDIQQQGVDIRGQTAKAKAKADAAKARRPDSSLSKVYGYIVNSNGEAILKNGKRQPVSKSASGGKKGHGVETANKMAAQMRGSPDQWDATKGEWKVNQPKVMYSSAIQQIEAAIRGRGYPPKEAHAIAVNAVNAHYGPGHAGRPTKKPKKK